MSERIPFILNGRTVDAGPDETIWSVAKREGVAIPHLCHADRPGYRPDGNCRACVVEVKGERTLAASCQRKPQPGMDVDTESPRATAARAMVFEMLAADMPKRADGPEPDAPFWHWHSRTGARSSRLPANPARCVAPAAAGLYLHDASHAAIAVNLDSCIACGLCERACREVQVNDVIGMGFRGISTRPVFDQNDPMGLSSCVACGECVEICPTGALREKSLLDAAARKHAIIPDRVVRSLCPYCGVGCQTEIAVKDDQIVKVDGRNGPANEGRLCVKGRFGFDYIRHPHRLTRPLIRRADAPKSGDIVVDPGRPWQVFREASWEEALDHAAGGLRRVADTKGGAAIAGFGSAKCSNEEAYLFQKLIRQGFGTNNVDHCTRLCHASSVAALLEGIGSGAVSAPFRAAEEADCIIVIGSRPTENHPVAATYFKQAAKRGATLIVMDPRGNPLAHHATEMLRFRPGTDVALLNAMLHVIIAEDLINHAYIAAHVDGFDALKSAVAAFSPEAMAPICGIDAEIIRNVARRYATAERSVIFWGMGVSQHVHGTDNARCLIALALITGQIGRHGTGLHPLRGQNNVQGASDAGLIPMMYPNYQRVDDAGARQWFEQFWGQPLDAAPGYTVVEIMHKALAPDTDPHKVRGMYIMGENPAMSDPDLNHTRRALASLQHLVVQDIFLTETAWLADVVLPASAWPEKTGSVSNTDRMVQLGRQALQPPGEARADLWIIQQLAQRLGLAWDYENESCSRLPGGRDGPVSSENHHGVEVVFEEMRRAMAGAIAGITWERLLRESSVTYPCLSDHDPGQPIVFTDRVPTPNGRVQLVPADIIPPDERPDADYPMVLITGRQLEHWHTGAMTRRAQVLDALEPAPTVSMHGDDLARLGLAPGALVRVASRRGQVTLAVRRDDGTPIGGVFIPFAYREAAANLLTNAALDPFGKIPEFKYCAVRVEGAP